MFARFDEFFSEFEPIIALLLKGRQLVSQELFLVDEFVLGLSVFGQVERAFKIGVHQFFQLLVDRRYFVFRPLGKRAGRFCFLLLFLGQLVEHPIGAMIGQRNFFDLLLYLGRDIFFLGEDILITFMERIFLGAVVIDILLAACLYLPISRNGESALRATE